MADPGAGLEGTLVGDAGGGDRRMWAVLLTPLWDSSRQRVLSAEGRQPRHFPKAVVDLGRSTVSGHSAGDGDFLA